MPNNVLVRSIGRFTALVGVCFACMSPARAEVTYNYADGWLFDSTTGYYWEALTVPSDTLIPSRGVIPELTQIFQLAADAGIPSLNPAVGVPAPYDPTLANFMAFFAFDAPAVFGETIDYSGLFRSPGEPPPGGYQYIGLDYWPVPFSTNYLNYSATTIGTYGPGYLCNFPDPNAPCPATQPAFVYSTVRPTPLPATTWLLLSGLALLASRSTRALRHFG